MEGFPWIPPCLGSCCCSACAFFCWVSAARSVDGPDGLLPALFWLPSVAACFVPLHSHGDTIL